MGPAMTGLDGRVAGHARRLSTVAPPGTTGLPPRLSPQA